MGGIRRDRYIPDFDWCAERVAHLRRLFDDGLSAATIAREISSTYGAPLTRNAVLGKCRRLGWKRSVGHVRVLPRMEGKKRTPDRWLKVRVREAGEYLPVGEQPVELPPDQSPHAVTFADLKDHHCRWPLGDPSQPDFMFCGATRHIEIRKDGTHHEKPYCARHCRMAYASPRAAQTPAFIDRGSMRRFA